MRKRKEMRGVATTMSGHNQKQSWYKAGRTTKYSTRLSVNYASRTHTDTHSGLRNGPN